MSPEIIDPRDADTGELVVSPWVTGVVSDISGTETNATTPPERRRVVVDESWISYHHPERLHTHHDLIVTTAAIARERDAVACTECYGGGVQYDFSYTNDGEVLP